MCFKLILTFSGLCFSFTFTGNACNEPSNEVAPNTENNARF